MDRAAKIPRTVYAISEPHASVPKGKTVQFRILHIKNRCFSARIML